MQQRILQDVFPHFAQGLLTHMQACAIAEDSTLDENRLGILFDGTLLLLYRLLFLLYAEARGLLPTGAGQPYAQVSISRMQQEIADHVGTVLDEVPSRLVATYCKESTALYERLQHLFRVLEHGDAALHIPMYSGTLFHSSPSENTSSPLPVAARFLQQYAVPDYFLAAGLDLLARAPDPEHNTLTSVDYQSLDVHLPGLLYEELLAHQLRFANELMAVVRGSKWDEQIIPYQEAVRSKRTILKQRRGRDAPERTIAPGNLYLAPDRRGRKTSGSFYTPAVIVQYSVAQTVGPLVRAKCAELRPRLQQVQAQWDEARMHRSPPQQAMQHFRAALDELFDLHVCDPAMGSGHFLLAAAQLITDELYAFLKEFPDNPFFMELRDTRQWVLAQMAASHTRSNPQHLTERIEHDLLKRHVLKRCIYGVDLDPMAVELAKITLWLDCCVPGLPLPWLDHHLKCGNALIGEALPDSYADFLTQRRSGAAAQRIEHVSLSCQEPLPQVFVPSHMVADVWQVEELADVTLVQVQQSRAIYRQVCDRLAVGKRVLDVTTSRWFGNAPDGEQQRQGVVPTEAFLQDERVHSWLENPSHPLPTEWQPIVRAAQAVAQDKQFFHWHLEFPEVFFSPDGRRVRAGFDAVIGNPPYVSFGLRNLSTLPAEEKAYYLAHFAGSAEYKISTSAVFMELALRLTATHGYHSFVVPDSFLLGRYFSRIRAYLLNNGCLLACNLIRHGVWLHENVGATVVYVLQKVGDSHDYAQDHAQSVACGIFATLDDFAAQQGEQGEIPLQLFKDAPHQRFRLIVQPALRDLIGRFEQTGIPLAEVVEFSSGLIGKRGQASLQTTHPSSDQEYGKLIVSGSSLERYFVAWQGVYCPLCPGLYKSGYHPHKYQHPKIMLNQTGDHLKAVYDADGYFCLNNMHIGTSINPQLSLLYITCLLNAKLMDVYYKAISLEAGRANAQIDLDVLALLPVCPIQFTTPLAERQQRVAQLVALYEQGEDAQLLAAVTYCLPRADIVHDVLVYLAQQMMELKRQQYREQTRFLDWLATALHIVPDARGRCGLDTLHGRRKLCAYAGDYQRGEPALPAAKLEAILARNHVRIGIKLANTALRDCRHQEYERSLAILRPIIAQLMRTDRLIDQVVYRLYGLSTSEIAMVERCVNAL